MNLMNPKTWVFSGGGGEVCSCQTLFCDNAHTNETKNSAACRSCIRLNDGTIIKLLKLI